MVNAIAVVKLSWRDRFGSKSKVHEAVTINQ
mgnify:CR=1 FL=1